MWPEQQPPGGEQNAQNGQPNPYQQPGEPNPYQQPAQPGGYGYPQQTPPQAPPAGYGYPQQPAPQPGAYGYPQQPAPEGQFGYPQQPGPDGQFGQFGYPQPPTVESWQPEPPKGRNTTKIVAIGAAVAVVVAASVTAGIVMNKDDGKKDVADDKPAAPTQPASPTANPRAGGDIPPSIPGWKVVANPKYGVAFDVPPEWKVDKQSVSRGFLDAKKNDGMPVVSMSGTATLKEEWCTTDTNQDGETENTSLADAGTKGGQGAKSTAEAARNEAGNWVWAGFAQKAPKGTVKVSKAKAYTSKSGLKGHYASASAKGMKKTGKCDTDGKALAFSFKTAKGDYASFVLVAVDRVKDEIPSATSKKIMSTVRLTGQ
ncbi:hypothetical protein LG634_28085 [Streptomyces bambusae]|uniref:hypothetical protein n=1 Tax=Streptomyces bambusae TaxID=1550616 RepID=UPI001CFCB72D|nr:hypothetical protein [Streptomyces bambusae]MCB5168668.1 hypothetical protein [Streptomyces bambusae]